MSWKPHIHSVSRKISKSIGIIYKSSFCLPKTSLHYLYYSLVYPYWTCCVSVLDSTYQSNLNRIIVLQKRIIRIISKVSFDAHTGVLFKEQEILKFSDNYLHQIGKFMYLFKRSLLPNYFRDVYSCKLETFLSYKKFQPFYLPHCRTNFRKFSIRFQGPTFFKSLSREIQNSESISTLLHGLPYSSRKPIVYKPPASI